MVLFRALAVYAPIPLPSLPNALWQSALLSFTQASGSSVPRVPNGQATTGLPEMSRCHPKSITACSKQSAFTSGGSELTCTSLIACEILSCFEHILVLSKGSIQQGHQGVNNTRPGKGVKWRCCCCCLGGAKTGWMVLPSFVREWKVSQILLQGCNKVVCELWCETHDKSWAYTAAPFESKMSSSKNCNNMKQVVRNPRISRRKLWRGKVLWDTW